MSSNQIHSSSFVHSLITFKISSVNAGGTIVIKAITFLKKTESYNSWSDPLIEQVGQRILRFLDGFEDSFMDLNLDLGNFSEFQQAVLMAARSIPRGKTVSYSKLAKMAGYGNAVRAAATVMRKNRFPIVIPCHRIIRSSGGIGGFCGKNEGPFVELKRNLIELEK